jgi:hypothetical protein
MDCTKSQMQALLTLLRRWSGGQAVPERPGPEVREGDHGSDMCKRLHSLHSGVSGLRAGPLLYRGWVLRTIFGRGAGGHVHVDGVLHKVVGGQVGRPPRQEAAREGVRDGGALLHHVAQLPCSKEEGTTTLADPDVKQGGDRS